MGISNTIKPVALGALTAANAIMTAAGQPRNSTKPQLDADGKPIEDSTSADINKKKTESPNNIQDAKSEAAKKAAADKAVKDSTIVPATGKQEQITGVGLIAAQQAAEKAAAEAEAKNNSNDPKSQSNSFWQGLNAELPSFNSSNSMPRGEDLQKTFAHDSESVAKQYGFTTPDSNQSPSSPDSQAAQGAAPGGGAGAGFGGLGGANAGPGGININSGNVNINNNNGSGNLGSFNNNGVGGGSGGSNVENFGGGSSPVTPETEPVPQSQPEQDDFATLNDK